MAFIPRTGRPFAPKEAVSTQMWV